LGGEEEEILSEKLQEDTSKIGMIGMGMSKRKTPLRESRKERGESKSVQGMATVGDNYRYHKHASNEDD
jgi:hypothetical protein